MQRGRAATASIVAVAALLGCGSSKKQSTNGTNTATSTGGSSIKLDSGFIARVNAVCARASVGAVPFPYTNFDPVHPNVRLLPKVGAFFAKRQAIADAIPGQLRALGQPATGQATWAQILPLTVRDRAIADRQIKAAEASDVPGFIATVNEITTVSNQLGRLAQQAGFTTSSPCRMIF
jgi:hypothetical protein